MKFILFGIMTFLFASCSITGSGSPSPESTFQSPPKSTFQSGTHMSNSGHGFMKVNNGYTSSGMDINMYNQIGEINIEKGDDGSFRESKLLYRVYNPESCEYESTKGIYDWIDETASGDIKEAGCFKNRKDFQYDGQPDFGYYSDENGTYYSDKEGGGYNLRRISSKTGGVLPDNLVTTTSSGGIEDKIPLLLLDNEVYMYGNILSGVTDPDSLKVMSLGGESKPINIVTDGKSVWYYKTQFESADPTTLRYLTGGIYVDRASCYISLSLGEIKKLENCNPGKIRRITTSDSGNWDTKVYSDETIFYNAYGDVLKPE